MTTISLLAGTCALVACVHAAPATALHDSDAEAELDARLARARHATTAGDIRGAVQEFHEIAAFYRRGGDKRSAAVADLEAARRLAELGLWDDAFATLAPSEGDEVESALIAQRQHIRVVVLERKGDVAAARASLAAHNRTITRDDWNRYVASDAERLGVPYGWPTLRRRWINLILVLEWGALVALVVIVYRRSVRRDRGSG